MKIHYVKVISSAICLIHLPTLAVAASKDTLVVTASGFEKKIQDAPASVTVITKKQIEAQAWRDITDALRDVPGVVVTGGGSKSDISIRGMASKYTLFLIDGKRINTRETRPNSDNSGIEQGWMPPLESIERIEVVRGPMSSLYGSDAMGGVINVITKKISNTRSWSGSLHADSTLQQHHDSGDLYQTNLYASGPLIDGLLGAKITGLISRRAEDTLLNGFNEQKMRNGGLTLNFTPDDKNDIDFEVTRELQDRNSTPGKSIASENCRKGTCEPGSRSDSRYEHTAYSLTHSGYYGAFDTTSYIQQEEATNPGREMKSYNTVFNNQSQIFLDDNTVTLGGQYRYEKLRDNGNQLKAAEGLKQLTRWNGSLFIEDEWLAADRLTLTGGLRMDKDEKYGINWTPRGYAVWHLTDQWTVKGGISAGYRAPDLRQSSAYWGQITGGSSLKGIIVGNSGLKPEKSLSEEVTLLWDNNDNLNAGITIYNTDFKNKITEVWRCNNRSEPDCTIGNIQYDFISDRVNVDKANIRGIESTFAWKITRDLDWTANYTYTQSEQKSGQFSGKPLNKMPTNMLNTTLYWQAVQNLGFWGRLNFRGASSDYLNRSSMAQGTPSYTLLDIGLRYDINKNLMASAGVYNLLDKRIDYRTYDAVLDGRRYTLGLSYSF
ncbi:ligand-gated channel protein [uncultured Cedecea sp.]|uniref:ligand-gated channel protein n=1 Tax=uncultured Cedecea sp. TaxID=988762 RepID=UPI00261A470D|nr:ligand-gated channel protein [uncultured Cedecea sp.]